MKFTFDFSFYALVQQQFMLTRCFLYVILFFIFSFPSISTAQNSFVKTIEMTGNGSSFFYPQISKLREEENEGLSFIITDFLQPGTPQLKGLNFIVLTPNGDIQYAYVINPEENAQFPFEYNTLHDYKLTTYRIKPLGNSYAELLLANFETNTFWRKKTSEKYYTSASGFTSAGKVYCAHSIGLFDELDKVGIALFDKITGDEEWNYYYKKNNIHADRSSQGLASIKELSDGSFIAQLSLAYWNVAAINPPTPSPLRGVELLHLDEMGNVIKSIGFGIDFNLPFSANMTIDIEDNIYLSFRNSPDNRFGVIVKFDKNFNILWAKKLLVENFSFRSLDMVTKPDGNIIFTHSTYGHLPVISGEISSDGTLLWYRGYAFITPKISIGRDQSIYFVSPQKYLEDGSTAPAFVVAKTTPEGDLEGCPQFDVCMSLEDITLDFLSTAWSKEVAPALPNLPVVVDTAFFESSPHCGTPIPPRASFMFPDMICQYECVSPDSVFNRFAHQIEWHITGPLTDTIMVDTTFNWCFDIPGNYEISQEIWLLGCSEYFVQHLAVLADNLLISLGEDRVLCDNPPYTLPVGSSRPLQGYLWQDSSMRATFEVFTESILTVTATDGYCFANDTVHLQFLDEVLDEDVLILPEDTVICKDNFPYILTPFSFYNQNFYLNNNTQAQPFFSLNTPGTYTIGIEVAGCRIAQDFVLSSSRCHIPIFIPNVFSPNNDGINDVIEPLGKDFTGIKLEIFNRWGGMVHTTEQFPFRWDGKNNGRQLSPGVYVLVYHYRNQKSGKTAIMSQEVVLMR